MRREEVEALLAVSVAGNDQWADAMQHKLTRRMTRELCRAWLAVDAAPRVGVRGKVGEVCMVPVSHDYCGKRVRIVPDDLGGAGK